MLATLSQAISRSSPTAAASVYSVLRNFPPRYRQRRTESKTTSDSLRIHLRQPDRNHGDIGLDVPLGHAGLQAAMVQNVVLACFRIAAIESDRAPQGRAALGEAQRHNAHERGQNAVQNESLTEDVRTLAEALGPQLVAQDEYRRRSGLGIL